MGRKHAAWPQYSNSSRLPWTRSSSADIGYGPKRENVGQVVRACEDVHRVDLDRAEPRRRGTHVRRPARSGFFTPNPSELSARRRASPAESSMWQEESRFILGLTRNVHSMHDGHEETTGTKKNNPSRSSCGEVCPSHQARPAPARRNRMREPRPLSCRHPRAARDRSRGCRSPSAPFRTASHDTSGTHDGQDALHGGRALQGR